MLLDDYAETETQSGATANTRELRVLDPSLASLGTQAQAQGFVERLAALTRATGLPLRLSELGIGPEHLDLLASEAMRQERLLVNNPCPISEADARRLYEAAL